MDSRLTNDEEVRVRVPMIQMTRGKRLREERTDKKGIISWTFMEGWGLRRKVKPIEEDSSKEG